jgi:hypothetical protein
MKNEHQEGEVPRGPLILIAPASNLVAVLSLDWPDGTYREVVSAKTHAWNYPTDRPRTQKNFGELSRAASRATPAMFGKLVV